LSNTTITPTVGAATLAGVALAMGLGISPPQNLVAVGGVAPTLAGTAGAPAFGGQPLSWSALKAGAAGASASVGAFAQARLLASGAFGSYGAALIQASPDNVNWTTLGAMTDAASPGVVLAGTPGLRVTPIAGGVVLSVTDPQQNSFRYLRAAVQGGDGETAVNVSGFVSPTGAV